MEKKNKIILIIICLVIVLGIVGCITYVYNGNKKDDDTLINSNINSDPIIDDSNGNIDNNFESSKVLLVANYDEITKMENTSYPVGDIKEDYFIVKKGSKYGVIDYNGNVIEEFKYDKITYLIDDYYYVEVDSVKTLKRNGNFVSDITKYDKGKIYRDNSDVDSLYIMLNEYMYNEYLTINEDSNIINLGGSLRAIYYKDSYDILGLSGKSSSIIYDASNGKVITDIKGAINKSGSSNNSDYIVTYELATYMRKYTYYDSDFEMITDGEYYFDSGQCDGNTYSSAVTDGSKKYGYFSVNNESLILPIEYQNIYSVNDDETLFVVKNNDKYALIDNNNKVIFAFEYEYMIIVNDYIVMIKDNNLSVYDNNLNKIDKYTFKLDKSKKITSYGLCEPEYEYINISRFVDDNLAKVSFYEDGEFKTLLFFDNKLELYGHDTNVTFGYSLDNDERYIILSNISGDFVKNVTVYDIKMNKLFDIDVSSFNISLSDNELPYDGVSSIYNISYDFDCKYFVISYNDSNDNINKIYFDLDSKEITDDALYLYCRRIDNDYFYYPIYNNDNSREKYELYNADEKIFEFRNDIEKIGDNLFLVDKSKIYKINE